MHSSLIKTFNAPLFIISSNNNSNWLKKGLSKYLDRTLHRCGLDIKFYTKIHRFLRSRYLLHCVGRRHFRIKSTWVFRCLVQIHKEVYELGGRQCSESLLLDWNSPSWRVVRWAVSCGAVPIQRSYMFMWLEILLHRLYWKDRWPPFFFLCVFHPNGVVSTQNKS